MISLSSLSAFLVHVLGGLAAAPIQGPTPETPVIVTGAGGERFIKDEFIVQFKTRSFDLSPLRRAILSGVSEAHYAELVAEIRDKNEVERSSFVRAVAALGGKVLENYWIINASAVRIAESKLGALEKLPNVLRVERNLVHEPVLTTATNSSHHNSDAVNTMQDVNKKLIKGFGQGVAILDTGADTDMGGTGRPHRLYYSGGSTTGGKRLVAAFGTSGYGVEDYHFHGTAVTHCAAGAKWATSSLVDNGLAPEADIVSIKVSTNSGSAASTWIISGWQVVMTNRVKYKIKAANNSFSGSPKPTDSIQQAVDSTAYNGDVLISLPSGNSGANRISRTQNAFNAISVGSANKGSLSTSSFSSYGTTAYGKQIPDLMAIGASVYMAVRDRETSITRSSGTSFSSPMVAGAALLVRQANPKLTALETKALLINNVLIRSGGTGRGAGFMRADKAVKAALANEVLTKRFTFGVKTKETFFFQLAQGVTHAVTVTWHRKRFSTTSNDDLDLYVYDPKGNLLGSSTRNYANSYERVEFTAPSAGTYRAVVTVKGAMFSSVLDFAVAGGGKPIPPKPPVLSSISPNTTSAFSGQKIVLTGQNLQTVSQVLVGSVKVSPSSVSNTQIQFAAPLPTDLGGLGTYQVKVVNPAGTSNALKLTIKGVHPIKLIGSPVLFSLAKYTDHVWTDAGWFTLVYLSGSNKGSTIPGLINLGIGNGFRSLFLFTGSAADKAGHVQFTWILPFGLAGKTFYFQAVGIDTKTFKTPFEVSSVLKRSVIF